LIFMVKWPSLATMPSLVKPHCNHHNYLAGVIVGFAGIVTLSLHVAASIALASSPRCNGVLLSLRWHHSLCRAGVCLNPNNFCW
jgi:hypothetical protein